MNTKEKFISFVNFEAGMPALKGEIAFWAKTLRRWYKEGLNKQYGIPDYINDGENIVGNLLGFDETRDVREFDVSEFFDFDDYIMRIPIEMGPMLQEKIIEEDETYIIVQDDFGAIKKQKKDMTSMPSVLKWPVNTRDDFEDYKAQFNMDLLKRLPENYGVMFKKYTEENSVICLGGYPFGFFGMTRQLLGPENLFYKLFDDPKLIKDIINFLVNICIEFWSKVLSLIKVDFIQFWEDIAFKTGPLISPQMFSEFLLPAYKRVTSFFREMGVKTFFVDSDGNIEKLIPLWIEGGINGFYPFEVNAGMDVLKIRKEFPEILMIGGIDKQSLRMSRSEIERELEKVKETLKYGGYIPCIDHSVPPDIDWEYYKYYRNGLNEIIENP